MALFTLGINHHTAPLSMRERLAFSAEELAAALSALALNGQVHECAILSTCNRSEIYFRAESPQVVIDWLCAERKIAPLELQVYLYIYRAEDAVRHVFRVACGLDSMVLGEPQILGQMKQAARLAKETGTLGSQLDKLFQQAFAVAKDVRSNTCIGSNIVSMAAAAVRLAERIFENLAEQRILFVGAGEMIELCATHFAARAPKQIVIANRTVERGQALAERFGGTAKRLDEAAQQLSEFDIVISCTASQLPIIGLGLVERAIRARRHRPIFMLDLAVPRDIEQEVAELDDVFLYTVDDLADIVQSGLASRQDAVHNADMIIAVHVKNFLQWLDIRRSAPLIRALRDNAERMRRHEIERAKKQLAKGEAASEILEQMSKRLMNKFLHTPSRALNQAEDEYKQSQTPHLVRRLFNLHGE